MFILSKRIGNREIAGRVVDLLPITLDVPEL